MNKAQMRRMSFIENNEDKSIKGKWIWKEKWYSICSIHMNYDKNCSMCTTGSWHNVWMLKINSWFHDHTYRLWRWWVNNI